MHTNHPTSAPPRRLRRSLRALAASGDRGSNVMEYAGVLVLSAAVCGTVYLFATGLVDDVLAAIGSVFP